MALNGYLTKNLAPFYEDYKGSRANKAFLAFLGQGDESVIQYNSNVNEVEYEITRGTRGMASLIKRSDVTNRLIGKNQKNLDLGSYTQVARAFPLSIEEYDITAAKLTKKLPGEASVNSGITQEDRAFYWAKKGQQEMIKRQVNLISYLASQSIITGYQDAILGTSNADEKYNFYRKSDLSKTLSVPWKSNPATAKPLTDLDAIIDKQIAASGRRPEFALMGKDALSAMLKTKEFQDFADIRSFQPYVALGDNVKMPSKFQRLIDFGWECVGRVTTWQSRELYIFKTEELTTVSGSDVESMPKQKVVLGNTQARVDGQFGPGDTLPETARDIQNYREWFGFRPLDTPSGEINLLDGIISPEMFYIDAYRNKTKTAYTIRSQTAPIIVPVATDDWATINNAGS